MLLQMVNGMVADMVADNEVDKVADMVAGHGCWLIGPKLFRPELVSCGVWLKKFQLSGN